MKIRLRRVLLDPLLLRFTLMTMAVSAFNQPVSAPFGLQITVLVSPSHFLPPTKAASPSLAGNSSPSPTAAPLLPPDVFTSHHIPLLPSLPPSGSSQSSPEAPGSSPSYHGAVPPAFTPSSQTNKRPSGAPSHPISHRPLTPPSHPSTIPGWPFPRPPAVPPSSLDSLPPDTNEVMPPPPQSLPPITPFAALPPPLASAGLAPGAAFTAMDDRPAGRSLLSAGVIVGIVMGGLLTGALVAMAMFVASKRKENIARAQHGLGLYREQL